MLKPQGQASITAKILSLVLNSILLIMHFSGYYSVVKEHAIL